MSEELLEAWNTNHRINLWLMGGVSEQGLRCSLSTRGGRDVARQFAHVHNNRLHHLDKRAPDLAERLAKFESKHSPSREQLIAGHEASTAAMGVFLVDVLGEKPKRTGLKKGIFTTLSYMIAHEAHHRGSILLTLKQGGHMPDKTVTYGIWDWDRR